MSDQHQTSWKHDQMEKSWNAYLCFKLYCFLFSMHVLSSARTQPQLQLLQLKMRASLSAGRSISSLAKVRSEWRLVPQRETAADSGFQLCTPWWREGGWGIDLPAAIMRPLWSVWKKAQSGEGKTPPLHKRSFLTSHWVETSVFIFFSFELEELIRLKMSFSFCDFLGCLTFTVQNDVCAAFCTVAVFTFICWRGKVCLCSPSWMGFLDIATSLEANHCPGFTLHKSYIGSLLKALVCTYTENGLSFMQLNL